MTEKCEPVPKTNTESQRRIEKSGESNLQQGSVPSEKSEHKEAPKQEKAPASPQ